MTTAFVPSAAAVPSSSFVPCTQQSAKVSSVFAKPTKVSSRFSVSASAPSLLRNSFAGLSLQEKSFFGTSVAQRPEIVEDAADFSVECMRHGNKLKKLNKPADQRKALLRALTTEVLRHGAIKCPLVRAKVLRAHVDHIITLAKDGSLHARRQAMGWVYDKRLVSAVFEKAPKRYAERNGGYTRVLRTLPRRGDNAPMGIIELV